MDACVIAGFSVVVVISAISLIGVWHSDDSKGVKIACTLNLAISMASFICAYYRNPFEFRDGVGMVGTIATIISIPVAVLIGWNIYTLIDIHKIRKEFNVLNRELSNRIEMESFNLHHSLSLSYNVDNESGNNEHKYFFIYHQICMIACNSRMGLYIDCNSIIENIISIGNFNVTSERIADLFLLIGEIKDGNKIDSYADLLSYLSSLYREREM